jgi:predicted RNA binding protein YcfA (HicA-like mRNA interferase family)
VPGKPRTLSGREVLRILGRFGFVVIAQRGSHIKIRWRGEQGGQVTISIPDHREIKRGTLLSIYRDACRAVPEAELRPHFFTED